MTLPAALLFLPLLLPWGDDFAAGLRSYREGRFGDALQAFTARWRRPAPAPRPSCISTGPWRRWAPGRWPRRNLPPRRPRPAVPPGSRAGVISCSATPPRARRPGRGGGQPAGGRAVRLDPAIALAEAALAYWQLAAVNQVDWPAARRNVERAVLKLAELRARKARAEAERQKKKAPDAEQPQAGRPDPQGGRDALRDELEARREAEPVEPAAAELTAEQVARLLDKLAEKERDKLELRGRRRQARRLEVERDW